MNEESYPSTNNEGKVLCQICGKPFSIITPGHLLKHQVTMKQYKLRFPDSPLTSSDFKSRQKYAKSSLFKKDSEETNKSLKPPIQKENIIEDKISDYKFPEEIIVNEEPEIEELEIDYKTEIKDPIQYKKNQILNCLKQFYSNIQMDYMIQKLSISNHLEYEFITDFADPILKVNIEFPKTFWHNQNQFNDPQRNNKLKIEGWKVIEIHSQNPSNSEIEKAIFN